MASRHGIVGHWRVWICAGCNIVQRRFACVEFLENRAGEAFCLCLTSVWARPLSVDAWSAALMYAIKHGLRFALGHVRIEHTVFGKICRKA
jgi:hypothetical protein